MEQFLIDNTERYHALVAAFKPRPADKKAQAGENQDIIVSTRIRPMLTEEETVFPASVFVGNSASAVQVHELKKSVRGPAALNSSSYTVDQVFGPDASTAQVYESLVHPLVPWAWGGGLGTVFSYGQTGSGKTFTVSGLERHVAETLMNGSLEGERKIHITIIELAGTQVYDLLNSRKQISILEDSLSQVQLAGAIEACVTTKDEFAEFIEAAASLRRTAPTQKNDTSSRSHAICRIRIQNPTLPSAEDGLLYLVDLAGSEAARDRTGHDSKRMAEARDINKSLSTLKDCIRGRALADADSTKKAKAYVPFRQSTLTKTLKHVFDPASTRICKTVVIACVNPCLADVKASINTLRYAELLRVVVPKRSIEYNADVPATWNNDQLKKWIDGNSGTPAISSTILAPHETGPQLLRLPIPEFLQRCLETADVSPEQAQAFQTKFWKLHVDSQHAKSKPSAAAASGESGFFVDPLMQRLERLNCSEDPEPGADAIPFKQRIRPGMVVCWYPKKYFQNVNWENKNYAMILSSVEDVGERVCDIKGDKVREQGGGDGKSGKYLACTILPAILPGAYTLQPWQQAVVDLEEVESEVLMEYDEATRYLYMTL
ncbi:P-loop containing nucleoside triphosphate hydrolase protein [Lasiosphaeris hirsuta]|uniref:P-loop containing nucleoside triphosphate hydrolase protein n=1 Tax=Lasiosphaeris hirsuta TaxID=260670 RepID=A0AA40E248_9PEZI|nr:P-loop containing nucleoside triphosphate hydrolase protein [Lasiosphaeris hirsuta]